MEFYLTHLSHPLSRKRAIRDKDRCFTKPYRVLQEPRATKMIRFLKLELTP